MTSRVFRTILCACVVASIAGVAGATPIQWTVASGGNGHWYDLVATSPIGWGSANSQANGLSYLGTTGHLATLTSAAENAFVDGSITINGWLGGYQDPTELVPSAGWHWVTGETWSYTNWALGEPNDNHVVGANYEQWLEGLPGGQWNDLPGPTASAYSRSNIVVEYDTSDTSTPEPCSMALLGVGLVGLVVRRRRSAKA